MFQEKEGIPHFANKAVIWKRLHHLHREGKAFHVFFAHKGRVVMSRDLLGAVTSVRQEADFGWCNYAPYRADVLLEREDAPSVALEVVHHHPPSADKFAEVRRLGMDMYEIWGGDPPFSNEGLGTMAAHLTTQSLNANIAYTERVVALYNSIAQPESMDDGFIRVVKNWRGSLDAHDRHKQEKMEKSWESSRQLRNEVRAGHVTCFRCGVLNAEEKHPDGGTSLSACWILVHRPNGGCGKRYVCRGCEFTMRDGWKGEYPADKHEWWPRDDCATCMEAYETMQERWQDCILTGPVGYVVNGRTVNRADFRGLLTLILFQLQSMDGFLKRDNLLEPWMRRDMRHLKEAIQDMERAMNDDDPNDKGLKPAGLIGRAGLPPVSNMATRLNTV